MVVPRHPQRFDAVALLIEQQGFTVSRRSNWQDGPPAADPMNTIWLGDSLGEMPMYYGLSDVALLGGSFEPLGGQNLIEAAACGCPVIMGPNTFNFLQAAELAEAAGAAKRVVDLSEAVAKAGELLGNPADQAAMEQAALGLSRTHRGALEKTVSAVAALLGQQGVHGL
jgi:3-deoxy-D-manno-octulosonic-acid transferase